jgi:integrase
VHAVKAKRADGSIAVYWYCRLTGARLPDITDPGFADAVAAARRGPVVRSVPGTLGALLEDWRASQEWAVTAEATKRSRDRYLAAVEVPAYQARQVVDLPPPTLRQLRADLLDLRDAIAADRGPGAGQVFGQAVASLFAWAVDRGRMAMSPLTRVRALAGGHIPAWTEPDAQAAMQRWPEPLRRAVVVNYHLGQRRGDLTQLRWADYDAAAGVITLQPEKTRRRREAQGRPALRLIVPSALAWELRRWRAEAPDAEHILTRAGGRAWTRGALSMAVRERLQAEGWDTKRGLHGLRKLRAIMLREGGASDAEIAAVQGWDSTRTVNIYTAGADQEMVARAALDRLQTKLQKTAKYRRKLAK